MRGRKGRVDRERGMIEGVGDRDMFMIGRACCSYTRKVVMVQGFPVCSSCIYRA